MTNTDLLYKMHFGGVSWVKLPNFSGEMASGGTINGLVAMSMSISPDRETYWSQIKKELYKIFNFYCFCNQNM